MLLDGTSIDATVKSIDASGNVSGEGVPDQVEVDGLRRIETPVELKTLAAPLLVELLGGSRLGLSKFVIDDQQKCHLHNEVLGEVVLPIDAIRAVRFSGGEAVASFAQAADEKNDEDRVFVKLGGGLEPIGGLIEEVDGFKVVIDAGDGPRSIARDKVYGIVFALVGRTPDHSGEALITLADGSTIWGGINSLVGGTLSISAVGDHEVKIPWAKVGQLNVRSTRLVFLSDLEPVEARHQPLVTLERPFQRDASVAGNPLTLAGREFDKGLGVASRSVLVFHNEGKFDLFAATIGIDEETEGRGDCEFVVEVDGREQFRQRVTGKDPPRTISVEIEGGQRISLLVEAGEDLDLSDHADWCDARFVKE